VLKNQISTGLQIAADEAARFSFRLRKHSVGRLLEPFGNKRPREMTETPPGLPRLVKQNPAYGSAFFLKLKRGRFAASFFCVSV
jgi:hypothetical protein